MKPRKVVIRMEVETDAPLMDIEREAGRYNFYQRNFKILRIEAKAIKRKEGK